MKRIISICIAATMMLTLAACAGGTAEANDYASYVPETAENIRTERDDGFTVIEYRDQDGSEYELLIDGSDNVRALTYDSRINSTATAETLTEDEAFAVVTEVYPEATLISAVSDRDDGTYEWNVLFADEGIVGEYELDAANGTVLEYSLFYGMTGDNDPAATIIANYPNAQVIDINLDADDGRLYFEGDALLDGARYEFSIDADTGDIREWKMDD